MPPLVDGCILLELIKHKPAECFLVWAESVKKIKISAITLEEFESALIRRAPGKDTESSAWIRRFIDHHCEILDVTSQIARTAARLRAHSGSVGRHLNQLDSLVAATAQVHDLRLITAHPRSYAECDLSIESLI